MAFSINRAILLGNLTRDPELRQTNSGKSVATLNLATNHSVKNQDGSYTDIPTFHRIVVWGKIADFIHKSCRKGTKVYVDGRIHTSEYEDKSGQKQRSREIIADNVIPMSEKQQYAATNEPETTVDDFEDKTASNTPEVSGDVDPNDIPF